MRRPSLVLLAAATAAAVVVSAVPGGRAEVGVHHLQSSVLFGSPADDTLVDVAAGGSAIVSTGIAEGALPGQTAHGGTDVFVRADRVEIFPELVPFAEQWTVQLGTSADDVPTSVAVDASETVVGGWTEGDLAGPSAGGKDGWVWTRNYDQEDWAVQIGGPDDDAVLDVAVSGRDEVFVGGHLGDQAFVTKYDVFKEVAWEGEVAADAATHLVPIWGGDPVYPSAQQLVVALRLPPAVPGGPDRSQVVALDVDTGEELWSTPPSTQVVHALTSDAARVYVAGSTGDAEPRAILRAYDATAGERLWTVPLLEEAPTFTAPSWATGAAWDSRWVVTTVHTNETDADLLVATSPTGRRVWSRELPQGLDSAAVAAWDSAYRYAANPLFVGGTISTGEGHTDAELAWYLTWQPDATASKPHGRKIYGNDAYGRRHQRMVVEVEGVRTSRVWLIGQNDGDANQSLRIAGCASHDGYRITYSRHAADVTHLVTGDGYLTGRVGPGESGYVAMEITPRRRTTGPTTCRFRAISPSTGESDSFTIAVRRP